MIFRFALWSAVCLVSLGAADLPRVLTAPTPAEGKRARAVTDSSGTVHLIFNEAGNVFYSRLAPGAPDFSEPIRVNSVEKSAAAANLAVGADGRVHVFFHGNIFFVRDRIKDENRKLRASDIRYAFYSRLNDKGDGFEEQRDLSGGVWAFDGGCAVAADRQGRVYLFMNGATQPGDETVRHIYMRRSDDHGQTFGEPKPVDLGKGVCACCHMNAIVTAQDELMFVYRVAEDRVDRDSYVMTSRDHGQTFQATPLDHWELNACPGSVYSFAEAPSRTFVSWRNKNEVYFTPLGTDRFARPAHSEASRRAAVLAVNSKGNVLMAWGEGVNFNRPHDLRWQLFDAEGNPLGPVGFKEDAFQRWGNPAVYSKPNGDFVILH